MVWRVRLLQKKRNNNNSHLIMSNPSLETSSPPDTVQYVAQSFEKPPSAQTNRAVGWTLKVLTLSLIGVAVVAAIAFQLFGRSQKSARAMSTPGDFCVTGSGDYGSMPIQCTVQNSASACPVGCGCVPVAQNGSGYCREGVLIPTIVPTIIPSVAPSPTPGSTSPTPIRVPTSTPTPGRTSPTPTPGEVTFPVDLTHSVVALGNPNKTINKQGWSLNIFDMQQYQGDVYFGGGSNNDNVGPTNIWKINDSMNSASADYVGNVENLYRLAVFDNVLYMPNADPLGKETDRWLFEKKQTNGWRGLPGSANTVKSAHMLGVYKYKDLLFVSGSERLAQTQPSGFDTKPMVWLSANGGTQFVRAYTDTKDPTIKNYINNNRGSFDALFVLGSDLYVTPGFSGYYAKNLYPQVLRYDTSTKKFESSGSFDVLQWIPKSRYEDPVNDPYGQNSTKVSFPHAAVNVNNALLYVAKYEWGVSNFGLTLKTSHDAYAQAIELPHNALAQDIIVQNGKIYVLANALVSSQSGSYGRKAYAMIFRSDRASTNPSDWKEMIRIQNPDNDLEHAIVMSFEMTTNNIYFTYNAPFPKSDGKTGNLYRVRKPAGF